MEKFYKHLVRGWLLSGLIFLSLLVNSAAEPVNYPKKLTSYRVVTSSTALTGTGISGATFNPYTNRIVAIDNNAVNWKEFYPDTPTTVFRTVTLSGFTDPESLTFVGYNAATNVSTYLISEEGLNRVSKCNITESVGNVTITRTTVGDCPTTTVMTQTGGADVWTPDVSNGMEGIMYKKDTDQVYVTKQRTALEVWLCDLDGTPDCTEPFDAATAFSGVITEINDGFYDISSKTLLLISNASDKVIRVNPATGAVLDTLTFSLGFTQEEGMSMSPDGNHLYISSEPTSFAHLVWQGGTPGGSSPFTATSNVISQTVANDTTRLTNNAAGTVIPFNIVGDRGANDMAETDFPCMDFRRFDSNELTSSQTNQHRARLCSEPWDDAFQGNVQAESGGNLRIETVLGTGTHGVNTNVINGYFNNLGHVKIGNNKTDIGGQLQIDGRADEIQFLAQGNATQTSPLVTIESSAGTDLFLFDESGAMVPQVSSLTIADNGGGTAAAGTLTPTTSYAEITCSDADGCTLAISETGARRGQMVIAVNISANVVTVDDTAGQQETTAPALGQYDTATFIYMSDRWVQYSTSNN